MPQISLLLSNNIDTNRIHFEETFAAIHSELAKMPNLNIMSCQSGVTQEVYSYVGLGDKRATRVYLEVLWLETSERAALKETLLQSLMAILENILAPQIMKQGLDCVPRVRIANSGTLNKDYGISGM